MPRAKIFSDEELAERQGVRQKKYRDSETEEGKVRRRARWSKYAATAKGKAANRRSEDRRLEKIRGDAGKKRRRKNMLRFRYGITEDDYLNMLRKQGGHCALCLSTPEDDRTGKLHIDHDHETGRVRGLLCHRHNHGLGALGDNESGLISALKYLRGEISHEL